MISDLKKYIYIIHCDGYISRNTRAHLGPKRVGLFAKMIVGDATQYCNLLRLPTITSISHLTRKVGMILQERKMMGNLWL